MATAHAGHGTLIVGASQAGAQLASSLREFGYGDPITLVGLEPHPPYQRPPLSKNFLLEDVEPSTLVFRSQDFWSNNNITLVTAERILRIDKAADGSGTAVAASGREFEFDRLALTVGARPRRLAIEGSDLAGILYLRATHHAATLRTELAKAQRVVVVGGGFIGLEVAASARKFGCEVTVVLADDRVLNRSVGETTSAFYEQAHARRGVAIYPSVRPARFLAGDGGWVNGVELIDGRVFPADLVVVGIGADARTELAVSLGLKVDNGIVVDEFGVTSDGTTVAAGDCVNCPNPVPELYQPPRLRFESVNAAVEQAKAAAATIAGKSEPFNSVPWFWSNQFDLRLQVVGLMSGYTKAVVRGAVDADRFAVLYYRGDRLLAADCVNRSADFVTVRSALGAGKTIPSDKAADDSLALKLSVEPVTAVN